MNPQAYLYGATAARDQLTAAYAGAQRLAAAAAALSGAPSASAAGAASDPALQYLQAGTSGGNVALLSSPGAGIPMAAAAAGGAQPYSGFATTYSPQQVAAAYMQQLQAGKYPQGPAVGVQAAAAAPAGSAAIGAQQANDYLRAAAALYTQPTASAEAYQRFQNMMGQNMMGTRTYFWTYQLRCATQTRSLLSANLSHVPSPLFLPFFLSSFELSRSILSPRL